MHFAHYDAMQNQIEFSLPEAIGTDLRTAINAWRSENKIARIWAKDASIWTGKDESEWLDWLTIVGEESANTKKYAELHDDIKGAGFTDILLMGMGGSSLCPEVLAFTFGKDNFHILDSTVPAQVRSVEKKINIDNTLFIVASKSGSTLEPNCFKQYFFERLAEKVGRDKAGRQFIAITDPGSKMEQVAKDDGFRHIFYGKPEIGGRFSALSAFGMTAAAAMGIDTEAFLTNAAEMVEACRDDDPETNPAAILGLILGVCHAHGRDKLTIFTTPEINDLGAWLEQLIAESTGKNDVAIIPVDRETPLSAADYGNDRVFAFLNIKGNASIDDQYDAVTGSGHPAVKIELKSIHDLGQEFFRWEFATAVAGSVMEINPFNQPDVESAKIEARKLTDQYEQTGKLPDEAPFFESDGIAFYSSDEYSSKLTSTADETTIAGVINVHLGHIGAGDYFGLLAYVEMNTENERLLQSIRTSVLTQFDCATCLGFGPRFLHSTGQAYKGGGNNGVFLQITSDDENDLRVPGQSYTFGIVKAAQARGDFQVLIDRDRRALRIHLGTNVKKGLEKIISIV